MLLVAAFVLTLAPVHTEADIIVDHLYRMGEDDPGAAAGQIGQSVTHDGVGYNDLPRAGTPIYRVAGGSQLSVEFPGNWSTRYIGSKVTNLTNNVGFEAWVKPYSLTVDHGVITNNGDGSTNGIGIWQEGSKWGFNYGGVIDLSGGTVSVGEWTDVAFVRDAGMGKLFVNGQVVATTTLTPSSTYSDVFSIGSNFYGEIDNVRVFHFAAGHFDANTDIVNSIPEPVTLSLLVLGGMMMLRRRK